MLLHSSDAVEDVGVDVEGPPSPRHLHMPKSGGIGVGTELHCSWLS